LARKPHDEPLVRRELETWVSAQRPKTNAGVGFPHREAGREDMPGVAAETGAEPATVGFALALALRAEHQFGAA